MSLREVVMVTVCGRPRTILQTALLRLLYLQKRSSIFRELLASIDRRVNRDDAKTGVLDSALLDWLLLILLLFGPPQLDFLRMFHLQCDLKI
jgi:hypothetical protein